jgi:pimeloyl-ACP methyl ester carboxylesterase
MVAAIPGAKLVIFEESGHMSTVENAPAVTAALRDWLTN